MRAQAQLAMESLVDFAACNSCEWKLFDVLRTSFSGSAEEQWDQIRQATHLAAVYSVDLDLACTEDTGFRLCAISMASYLRSLEFCAVGLESPFVADSKGSSVLWSTLRISLTGQALISPQ